MNKEQKKTGVKLIAEERKRQVEEEGWTPVHDASHDGGELALAAICYASPVKIYVKSNSLANCIAFDDPWPWGEIGDKRYKYGESKRTGANYVPNPKTYTKKERLDLLIKAGALIAAEIDRLQNSQL